MACYTPMCSKDEKKAVVAKSPRSDGQKIKDRTKILDAAQKAMKGHMDPGTASQRRMPSPSGK